MSCPINKDSLNQLKQFIDVCKSNPGILHLPDLSFLKNYIESLGGKIPPMASFIPTDEMPTKSNDNTEEAEESEPESDLELDTTGCIEPDTLLDNQEMGETGKEISEEDEDKANEKRSEAMHEFSEGNYDKAIELFTEAIKINPNSALLFAKRGQTYLKQNKPNACIKDCTKALELNCDSAASYKYRGRAYRLLGNWEAAAKDLRQACKIDFDEQTNEWLKEVEPNAKKIEQHLLKKERRQQEKLEKERLERIRKAKESHERAAQEQNHQQSPENAANDASEAGSMPGMGDFYKILQDPEVMAALSDPEVAAVFADIRSNPANFAKYQSNPKVMELIKKLSSKFGSTGMNFPGFPGGLGGGFPGAGSGGGFPRRSQPQDDDLLD